ncbi:MAG: hypothetical protein V7721_09225 [Porticoccaceae bacterium]
MKLPIHLIGLILSSLILASCADINTVMNAPKDAGASQIFTEDHELVKAAVLASMQNLNINIKETSQTANNFTITFTKTISAFSWGEVGRVLVTEMNNGDSQVFVHSEKRLKHQIAGANNRAFSGSIFSGVTEILNKN